MVRVRNIKALAALAVVLSAAACNEAPPPVSMARGKALFETCTPCHGDRGLGNASLSVPSIAGLPAWYVEKQLRNFQASIRGANPYDTIGLHMESMSRTMDLKNDIPSVAMYVASLPRIKPTPTLKGGDVQAGATVYERCVACHGAKGQGNKVIGAPPLAGASDYYLLRQLEDFKKGWRGTNPKDIGGQTMRPNALPLDQRDLLNVVAYISTLK